MRTHVYIHTGTRWIQVGAFSPFSRNHNGLYDAPQELYRWESVAEASRTVLTLRYRLLPYLYTLLYKAHLMADTVLNAMWMHFPEDRTAFFRDGQYMWANGILFTPVLLEGATSVEGYFPRGLWYSLFDDSLIDASTEGMLQLLETPLLETNAHVRGGTVIPMQEFKMTTAAAKVTPVTLLVALDSEGAAGGSLFMDDGDQIAIDTYSEVEWRVSTSTFGTIGLTSKVLSTLYECLTCTLGAIEVLGVVGNTCTATLQVGGAVSDPAAVFVALASTESSYSSVTVTFDNPPNIFSELVFQVSCYEDNTSPDNDSSSDNDGFTSLPGYAQGLIITTCVIFGLAILFVISKVVMFKNESEDRQSSLEGREKIALEGSSFNDPLLALDEEEVS